MPNLTRLICSLLVLLLCTATTMADEPQPAQIMLFGTFHFANPGLDVVKTDQVNVMTEENQTYLAGLTKRLAEFDPTVVLLEFDPDDEPEMQEKFSRYLQGAFELPNNEVYQIGFRVAANSAASTVHSFDETTIGWDGQALFEHLEKSDTETGEVMSALIERITNAEQIAQSTLSLKQLLMRTNDPDRDALNRSFYILTNHVGDGSNFVGADATASWWHRNFRMYARVQRYARPGERVLLVGGQGHTSILKQLLADDRQRVAVDVTPYL